MSVWDVLVLHMHCNMLSFMIGYDVMRLLQIVGVFEKDGQKLPHTLTGKWDTALEVESPGGGKEKIWEVNPRPADNSRSGSSTHMIHRHAMDTAMHRECHACHDRFFACSATSICNALLL